MEIKRIENKDEARPCVFCEKIYYHICEFHHENASVFVCDGCVLDMQETLISLVNIITRIWSKTLLGLYNQSLDAAKTTIEPLQFIVE